MSNLGTCGFSWRRTSKLPSLYHNPFEPPRIFVGQANSPHQPQHSRPVYSYCSLKSRYFVRSVSTQPPCQNLSSVANVEKRSQRIFNRELFLGPHHRHTTPLHSIVSSCVSTADILCVIVLFSFAIMGISRDSRHKRSATGAKRAYYRKKR